MALTVLLLSYGLRLGHAYLVHVHATKAGLTSEMIQLWAHGLVLACI
jgi:hypothetical protein